MLTDIIAVEQQKVYRLYLRFEDGAAGEVDIAALVEFRGVFAPLRDKVVFDQVSVDANLGTVVWPKGADIDPDVLYAHVTGEPLPDFAPDWLVAD